MWGKCGAKIGKEKCKYLKIKYLHFTFVVSVGLKYAIIMQRKVCTNAENQPITKNVQRIVCTNFAEFCKNVGQMWGKNCTPQKMAVSLQRNKKHPQRIC